MDEVLELTLSPIVPVIDNFFYLIFFFIINHLSWWPWELGPVFRCFLVRGQKQTVEDIVDGPGPRQLELVSNWQDFSCDLKGAMVLES